MISKNVKVEVALREEDRPIAFLVQMASQFESKILFETGNKQVNVKSMMGMMSLGLDLDRLEDLTVVADGADEEEAVSKIEGYLTKGAQIQYICAFIYAEIAQLVEHFTRNEGVAGSSPVFGLILIQAELPVFLFELISNKKELPQFGSSFYFISINTVNSINPRS